MLKFILSKPAIKAVGRAIDSLFNRAKRRFLGQEFGDHEIRFGVRLPERAADHRLDLSLKGLFDYAARAQGFEPNRKLYESVEKGIEGYFNAHKDLTKARVIHEVQSYLHEAEQNSAEADPSKVLGKALEEVFTKTTNEVEKIVDSESTRGRNISTLDAVSKLNAIAGVTDPVIAFLGPNDANTCKECLRIFFMPDGTPKAWLASELRHVYFKKGDQSPCVAGCHPHCRHSLISILPGYGFIKGSLQYISPGYSVIDAQRK